MEIGENPSSRSGAGGRQSLDRQRVNLAFHEVGKRLVDQTMPRHRRQAAERRGDDAHAKMARPAARARVPLVQMTLVRDRELDGREGGDEPLAQPRFARRTAHGGAAPDGTGLVFPCSQKTWGIMNTSIAALMPNTLKFTHTLSVKLRAT